MRKILTILMIICYSCTLFSQNNMNEQRIENCIITKGEISIYPNPTTDEVIIVTNEYVNSVAIYSVGGSLIASSESNIVNVANLVNGIYVVKANTEAGVITGQIIKKGFSKTVEELQKERTITKVENNDGYTIHVGPRGGVYHYSKNGKKVYHKRK